VSPALSDDDHDRWWFEVGSLELRQLLYWRWDPLNVAARFPATVDEYDAYVRDLRPVLQSDPTPDQVAAFLGDAERTRMGFGATTDAMVAETARQVVAWQAHSIAHWRGSRGR
jgi:hypothetical protein